MFFSHQIGGRKKIDNNQLWGGFGEKEHLILVAGNVN